MDGLRTQSGGLGRRPSLLRVQPPSAEMQRISDPAPWPAQPTFAGGGVLDHLFFRLPAGWRGTYRRAPHSYGSDHFPVVGWIDARPDPAR